MIFRVRLQRKFNPKSNFDYAQRIMLVFRIQIIFELSILLLTCLFSRSLDLNLDHIFVCEFWTNDLVFRYNLAIFGSCLLFCPYLIKMQKIKVSLVKDCYFTVLLLHSFIGTLRTYQIHLGYLLFVGVVGYSVSLGTQYIVMVLEQKKLIEEINFIEGEDRKTQESELSSLTFQLSDSL